MPLYLPLKCELDPDDLLGVTAWSPDGNGIAAAALHDWEVDGEYNFYLWDLTRPGPPSVCGGHSFGVDSLAWSPDGGILASGDSTAYVRLWDPRSGAEMTRVQHADRSDMLTAIKWSPCGRFLGTATLHSDAVIIWTLSQSGPGELDSSNRPVRMRSRTQFTGHRKRRVNQLAWSPDGRWIASWGSHSAVRVWDPHTGAERAVLRRPDQRLPPALDSVSWSPGSDRLACPDVRGTIRVWEPSSGGKCVSFGGADHKATPPRWSDDGRSLWTAASSDDTLRLWDASTGRELHRTRVSSVLQWAPYSVTGGVAVVGGTNRDAVRFLDVFTGDELARGAGHPVTGRPASFAEENLWSPCGRWFALIDRYEGIRIWDVRPLRNVRVEDPGVTSWLARQALTVGRRPATTGPRRTASLPVLSSADGACVGRLSPDGDSEHRVFALAIAPDSSTMYTLAKRPERWLQFDPDLHIWDMKTGQVVGRHRVSARAMALSPDGRTLALGDSGGRVRTLDTASREFTEVHRGPGEIVRSLQWSVDGSLLAFGIDVDANERNPGLAAGFYQPDHRGELQVIRAASGRPHATLSDTGPRDPRGCLSRWTWMPDGRIALVRQSLRGPSSWDIRVCIWQPGAPPGEPVYRREFEHRGSHMRPEHGLRGIAVSPDGRLLAVGSSDEIDVWNLGTGSRQAQISVDVDLQSEPRWSPHDLRLAATFVDGSMSVWDGETGEQLVHFERPGDPSSYDPAYYPADSAVAWAPSDPWLATCNRDRFTCLWNPDHDRSGRSTVDPDAEAPMDLASLSDAMAALARLAIHPPASLVRDLHDALGPAPGHGVLVSLRAQAGFARLADLGWPGRARIGLLALLLRDVALHEWRPPPGLDTAGMRVRLRRALFGEAVLARPPVAPRRDLLRAAAAVDERLLARQRAVGPDSVVRDPGLPLRLLQWTSEPVHVDIHPRMDVLAPTRHRRNEFETGRGPGQEPAGACPHGPPAPLLPSQLALDRDLFTYRACADELLYRSRFNSPSPRMLPAVVVLDVTPPTFGPVGRLLRSAACAAAEVLLSAGQPIALVTAGGECSVSLVRDPTELVLAQTHRSSSPLLPGSVMELAARLQRQLRRGPEVPIVLLFTHVRWGGAEAVTPTPPRLRALFVQDASSQGPHPEWEGRCERAERIHWKDANALSVALGRLIA